MATARLGPPPKPTLTDEEAASMIADFLTQISARMSKGSRLRSLALRSAARWMMATRGRR